MRHFRLRRCIPFFLFVLDFFVVVFFNPRIIATRTVAGKGQNIEDPTAHLLGNADPGPAGKQRQPRSPNAQKRNGAAAAVQHRLQCGTQ